MEPYLDQGEWYVGYGTLCEAGEYPDGISEWEAEQLLREVGVKMYIDVGILRAALVHPVEEQVGIPQAAGNQVLQHRGAPAPAPLRRRLTTPPGSTPTPT